VKARDGLSAGEVNGGSSRWMSLAALALLVACGGGGGATGTTPLGDGSGTTPFGSGAGTPPFGAGSGTGGLTGDGARPTADPAVVVSDDAIQGTVINSRTGIPLSGATVNFSATSLTTSSVGAYGQQTAAASSRVLFEVNAANYETLYAPAEVLGTVPSVGLQRLTAFGTTADVTVASGGTVTDTASSASVTLPANAVVPAGGGAAPATVGVRVTQIAVATDSHVLSGDYTDDKFAPLETYGGVTLSSSVPLDVASGQTLTLNIPVSSRGTPPATTNLYLFDRDSGRWVQSGTATLSGGVYTGAVSAFGQWMAGEVIANPVAVTGCVNDDAGAPAANVRVEADGGSYSGTSAATTNAQGQFTLLAKPGSRIVVSGRRGPFLTNAAAAGPTSFAISPCLTLPSSNAATMRLTWGASPSDIDSHLRTPDGSHVFYSSKGLLTTAPFASLDVDDVTGFGPEVTTIRRPRVGIYRFYLHNFSQTFTPGMTGSPTRVELNYVGRTVVFSPPPGEGSALYWHLFDLYIAPNCTMTLYRYNRWRADEPQNPNASTTTSAATECVPS
jgi:hypothetical protein